MVEGYLETVSDSVALGWARDTETPQPVVVDVFCDGNKVGSALADVHREDLQAAFGAGRHAFAVPLPAGVEGEISACVANIKLTSLLDRLNSRGPHVRRILASSFIAGSGVEIGALDKPMWTPPNSRVGYVDRLPTDELRKHYNLPLARAVDHVCDAQTLETLPDTSQDFVIANHVFEHMQSPLLALANWLRVLRPMGVLFMAIPDKRFTFDRARPSTTLAHVLGEYHEPDSVKNHRRGHVEEWVRLVEREEDSSRVEARIQFLLDCDYSIHVHAWTGPELASLFAAVSWLGYEMECYKFNDPECVVILRKSRDTAMK